MGKALMALQLLCQGLFCQTGESCSLLWPCEDQCGWHAGMPCEKHSYPAAACHG